MSSYELYIDDNGVKRGYYVYLHKVKSSEEVFYVGKGSGTRAWDNSKRNTRWKKKVNEIDGEYEIEIFEDDLTELEAFGLEEELVEKYGFFDDSNDQLTNRVPGGENPATISISFGSSEKPKWDILYEGLRSFEEFDKQDKKEFAKSFINQVEPYWEKVQKLEAEYEFPDDIEDEEEYHQPIYLVSTIEESYVSAIEFLKSRISWQDFCLGIEYSHDGFEIKELKDDKTNRRKFSDESYECFKQCRKILNEAYKKIDSGNRDRIRALVNQKLSSLPTELSSQIPYKSNRIKIKTNKSLQKTHRHIRDMLALYGFEFTEECNSTGISTYFLKLGNNEKEIELRLKVELHEDGDKVSAIFIGLFRDSWLKKILSLQTDDLRGLQAQWNKVKHPRRSFSIMTRIANQLEYDRIEFLEAD